MSLNVSDFDLKWHQDRAIHIDIKNKGNSIAKDISLQIRADKELTIVVISKPDDAEISYEKESNRQRISIKEMSPNETISIIIKVETGWFYLSISKLTSLLVSVEYKDDRNKFFEDYRDGKALQINLKMSNFAKVLLALIFGSIATLIILRVRASMASRPRRRFKRSRRFG